MPENIIHCAGIRLRVNGAGVLRPRLIGLDDVIQADLSTYTMSATPGREPIILANFKNQRFRLKLGTTAIDETMKIQRIIVFVKDLYTGYPQ